MFVNPWNNNVPLQVAMYSLGIHPLRLQVWNFRSWRKPLKKQHKHKSTLEVNSSIWKTLLWRQHMPRYSAPIISSCHQCKFDLSQVSFACELGPYKETNVGNENFWFVSLQSLAISSELTVLLKTVKTGKDATAGRTNDPEPNPPLAYSNTRHSYLLLLG